MGVNIEPSWKMALQKEFEKEYFIELTEFVDAAYENGPEVFPPRSQVFRAFNECAFEDVRVVILGQDPYPTIGHAHGLCFSCDEDVRPLPKSLKNIYKELSSDVGIEVPKNGDLIQWSRQGVLLLNSVLTVEEGEPDSHSGKGWERFTDEVINQLNSQKSGIVYMLWGSKALRKADGVNAKNNLVLHAPHPSPLSAYRGFFGCRHFTKANDYLIHQGKSPINW